MAINIIETKKHFVLVCITIEAAVSCLLIEEKPNDLKQTIRKWRWHILYFFGNISKYFTIYNKKRLGLLDMCMIFQLIIIVLMLPIFWTSQTFKEKIRYKRMFGFIKQVFSTLLDFCRSLATKFVSCLFVSCLAKLTLIDASLNEPLYYPLVVSVDKCSGSCNTIDDPYTWVCVPN